MASADINITILAMKGRIVDDFNSSHWQDIALLTDSSDIVNGHGRLLRSLGFGDDDYPGNVVDVLLRIVKKDPANLDKLLAYVDNTLGDNSEFISAQPSARRITFAPSVFAVPEVELRNDLVAVMMPFAGFDAVYTAIKNACSDTGLDCLRADDIWDESTFIQDIVNLIFQARIVVCDFTKRNPNVFYETGIAHTLGKTVVPISQALTDIPSDLQHHRALPYLANSEGLQKLRVDLAARLTTIATRPQSADNKALHRR
ncbi:MAG: hypothetical protein IID44_19395 [Planctomycetes bacterium]|nr:hypothetical protein [Planctomycetota bacterium]